MTDEMIDNAADKFAESEYEISNVDRIPLYKGFFHGAKWRIDSVWNSNKVKPDVDDIVLVQYKYNNSIRTLMTRFPAGSSETCYSMQDGRIQWDDVINWAYASDLVPDETKDHNALLFAEKCVTECMERAAKDNPSGVAKYAEALVYINRIISKYGPKKRNK